MTRSLVALVVIGLVLTGCGDDGDPEADLADRLQEDFDLPAEQADCVAAQAFDRLTDEELDLLRDRDAEDDLSPDLRRKLEAAVAPCASAGS